MQVPRQRFKHTLVSPTQIKNLHPRFCQVLLQDTILEMSQLDYYESEMMRI